MDYSRFMRLCFYCFILFKRNYFDIILRQTSFFSKMFVIIYFDMLPDRNSFLMELQYRFVCRD